MKRRRRHVPLPSRTELAKRLARSVVLGLGLIMVSLAIGVVGDHVTAGLGWIDALLNASALPSRRGAP